MKKYVVTDKNGSFLTGRDGVYRFTDNLNLALIFESEADAVQFEDKHGNDIEGLTYVSEVTLPDHL